MKVSALKIHSIREIFFRGSTIEFPRGIRWVPTGFTVVIFAALSALAVHSFSNNPEFKEVLPKRGDLEASILVSGRIQPDNRVDIKAPIAGRVEKILVQEGESVKKGQTLLWVSSSERAATLDAARVIGPEEVAHWEKVNPATPVIAPVDGLIIQKNIEPGQSFANTDAILVLSDRFVVEAPIDETDVARVKPGQDVTTTLDSYPDHRIESKILRVAHEATNSSGVITYKMEIELKDPPDFVRVGMTANVSFRIEARKNVLLVPSTALKATKDELYLLVANPRNGKPEKRPVKIGLSDGVMTEITAGLETTDTIYVPAESPLEKSARKNKRSILSM